MAPFLSSLLRYGQAVLSLSQPPSSPTAFTLPLHLNLSLTPIFDSVSHSATALSVVVSISSPNVHLHDVFVQLPLMIGSVPAGISGDAVQAADANGPLVLHHVDDHSLNQRSWYTNRDTHGDVSLTYTAYPRNITETTLPGPRVDLRLDQGGLMGGGMNFIPVPPESNLTYDIHVAWDLSHAPSGTISVWTYGEGNSVRTTGLVSTLAQTYYAVGAIHNYAPSDKFVAYWFGDPEPLFNATQLASSVESLFARMAPFFEDHGASYRVFIRHSTGHGFGGTALDWSFMIEYDDYINLESEDELFILIVHEMVHNWPMMESIPGAEALDAWYTEGIAEYYAVILPYRWDFLPRNRFLKQINEIASAYYTSPARSLTNAEADRLAWSNTHAQRIPYYRGAMYHLQLQSEIVAKSSGSRSLDNLVLEFLRRKEQPGIPFGIADWQELLASELGRERAEELYTSMAEGKLIIPPGDALGPCFNFQRRDQFVFDLGFSEKSLSEGVVRDVKPLSRADRAGLRNGDEIVWKKLIFQVASKYEAMMELRILRKGGEGEKTIRYWPRSYEKVEAWEWILNSGHEGCVA